MTDDYDADQNSRDSYALAIRTIRERIEREATVILWDESKPKPPPRGAA